MIQRINYINENLISEQTDTNPNAIFTYRPLRPEDTKKDLNSFENDCEPDEWCFKANFKNPGGNNYFPSDVAVFQYQKISQKQGFYGQLPKRIVRFDVTKELTKKIMDGVTEPTEMLMKFMTTPNGKASQRLFDIFDLTAKKVERVRYPGAKNDSYVIHVGPKS